jgi:hypothetical protein
VLPPETALLIREQVARINACLFCIDIGRSFTIKASMNEAKFDALEQYRTSALFTDRERAALDYVTELTRDKRANPETFARVSRYYSEREICEIVWLVAWRASLQHDQHQSEHPFGHALRHQQEETELIVVSGFNFPIRHIDEGHDSGPKEEKQDGENLCICFEVIRRPIAPCFPSRSNKP